MAIDPIAVTIHDSSEIAPTLAMLVGSMMIPDPIMFTATMNVSWTSVIFFVSIGASNALIATPARGPRTCGTESFRLGVPDTRLALRS